MSYDESTLLKVQSVDGDKRELYIDEENGVALQRDANGKLQTMADLYVMQGGEFGGEYKKRDMGIADVHIPSALSNYAAGYQLAGGIAERVAPVVLVDKASDYYMTFSKDDAFAQAQDLVMGEGDKIKEIAPSKANTLFTTVPYGIGCFVPQGLIANADAPLNPRLAYMNRLMNAMRSAQEVRTAAIFTSSAFSGFTSALGSTTYWDTGTSSDPKKDLDYGRQHALQVPTEIVFGNREVWDAFTRNPNVLKYTMYKDSASGFQGGPLMGLLDLPSPIFGEMRVKSVSAGTYGYVWGDIVIVMHNQPGVPADQQTIGCAKTFRWRKGGLAMDSSGFRVRMFFDPFRGQDGGEVVVVACNEVPVITGAASSYLFTDVLST